LNLALALALVWHFKQGGLGIANTATSLVNVSLLLFALRKKMKKLEMESLRKSLLPLLLLTVFAGLIAWQSWRLWEGHFGHANLALKIGAVFVPAILAGLVYLLAALLCKIPAAQELTAFAFAKFRRFK